MTDYNTFFLISFDNNNYNYIDLTEKLTWSFKSALNFAQTRLCLQFVRTIYLHNRAGVNRKT